MRLNDRFGIVALVLMASVALLAAGCGKDDPTKGKGSEVKQKDQDSQAKGRGETSKHEGWWCEEHGVPEHLCSLCLPDAKVKTMFKDKGDWCKVHDRAQSQCFKCDPNLYAKYEAMYEAKFNKKPRRPPPEEFEK